MRKLLLGLMLLAASAAHGAIAFVQAPASSCVNNSSITTETCTFPSAVQAGDTLVAIVGAGDTSGGSLTVTLSDSVNGSWTQAVECFSAYNGQVNVFYFAGAAAGSPTVTATSSASASGISITMAEYSGVAATPLDGSAVCSAVSGAQPNAAPNVTLSAASDWVLGLVAAGGNSGGYTVASPYTLRVGNQSNAPYAGAIADDAPGVTGTATGASFSLVYTGNAVFSVSMALKAAGSAPVNHVQPRECLVY